MLERFIEKLPKNIDGALIISPENRRYFTDFDASDGYLFATKNGSVFLTDSRYIEAAQSTVKCCDAEEQKMKLSEYAARFDCKTLAVEADRLTVSQLKTLRKALHGIKLTTVGTDKLIDSFRAVKTGEEVEDICTAQRIAEDALNHILGFIKVGVTEKEIALELDHYMLSHGAEALSFETIAISGANTSKPHGVPTDKRVEKGDFVTMDFGAVVNGFFEKKAKSGSNFQLPDVCFNFSRWTVGFRLFFRGIRPLPIRRLQTRDEPGRPPPRCSSSCRYRREPACR